MKLPLILLCLSLAPFAGGCGLGGSLNGGGNSSGSGASNSPGATRVYTGSYSITCPDCDAPGVGETGYGSIVVTVNSSGDFTSVATTKFSSNVNGDKYGSDPVFNGTVSPTGVINASSANNANGCQNFFAAPYTTGKISTSGVMTVNYSQPAMSLGCPAASGSISATLE